MGLVKWGLPTGLCIVATGALHSACSGNAAQAIDDDAAQRESNRPPADESGVSPPGAAAASETSPSEAPDGEPAPQQTPPPMTPVLDEAPGVIIVTDEPQESTECVRQIEFGDVALAEAPAFDVVIVADHSDSLSWSRDDLSNGLAELLAQVRGRDVRFFVLTPTQYGAESAAAAEVAGEDLITWRDPVTGEAHENAVTSYRASCSTTDGVTIPCPSGDLAADSEYRLEGSFEFRMPAPVAVTTRDMSPQQVAEQQQAIQDAILALAAGASYEQPLCTLGRYVAQTPELLPENVVFVILSDEDDMTEPRECLTGFVYEHLRRETFEGGCTSNCDFHRYTVRADASRYGVSYRCVPTNDFGATFPDLAEEGSFSFNPVDSCNGVSVTDCTAEDLATVASACSPGALIESCERSCAEGTAKTTCSVDLPADSADACGAPFELDGVTYADAADYCSITRNITGWGSCAREGFTNDAVAAGWYSTLSPRRLVSGTSAEDLLSYFVRNADNTFGADNYFVETIVFHPDFTCEPQAGQSYAINLATLATTPDDVFPICESYAPALARVRGFAQALLQTEYTFELSDREDIQAIVVTDADGVSRELGSADYEYNFDSAQLTLNPETITSNDRQLTVELTVHCAPLVR